MSAPQARKFLGYMTIFKGKHGYERAAGAKILGTPDFSNLRSQFLPKSQFPPTFLKSQLPPPLKELGSAGPIPVKKTVIQNKNEINPNDCKIKSDMKLP